MKRMIDNKDYEDLKKDVNDIEAHTSDFVINQVVYDSEAQKVEGVVIKDVENEVTYTAPLGSQVEANPVLEGGETALSSIGIDGTNYAIGGGNKLYQHFYEYANTSSNKYCSFNLINDKPTMTYAEIISYFMNKGWTSYDNSIIFAIGGNNSGGAVSFGKVFYDSTSTNLKWLKIFQSANFELLDPTNSTASEYAKITSVEL